MKMRNVVLDTNVVISAVLSKNGSPSKALNHVTKSEKMQLLYTPEIIAEYDRVLSYTKLNISKESKSEAIRQVYQIGKLVEPSASTIPLPDEDDRIFYDAAKTGGALLVTGNIKHYPDDPEIVTPAQFLELIKE